MREIWALINEMSPYLLLGFGFAGLLHAFVPTALYHRYLGENNFRSVVWATLLGVPLPLCSCGVIPTAMSLHKEGASKGATTSFLISTPQTGVDSILATASLMGIPFAILRPVAALVTGLVGGQIVNVVESKTPTETLPTATEPTTQPTGNPPRTFGKRLLEALRYGYVDMVEDIGKWLVLGLVLAGLITIFVPDDFFLHFANTPLLSMLVVLAISIPMYVCATGSIPVAVALMLKGITPGAALVLLMAGPASNMASILVIRKVLGKRTLWIYLLSITLGAVTFGLLVDYLLPAEWFTAHIIQTHACCHQTPALLNVICSGLLGCLLLYALIRRFIQKKDKQIMEKKVFKIDGMMCNHCRANVEKTLRSFSGVIDVEVDLIAGKAVVEGVVDDQAIVDAIRAIGYEAKKL